MITPDFTAEVEIKDVRVLAYVNYNRIRCVVSLRSTSENHGLFKHTNKCSSVRPRLCISLTSLYRSDIICRATDSFISVESLKHYQILLWFSEYYIMLTYTTNVSYAYYNF